MEKLSAEDLYNVLDEIPSDNESIYSDYDSDSEDTELPAATNHEVLDWDSEDELPLAAILPAVNTALNSTIQWSKNVNNILQPRPFVEHSGPNIPDDLETPLDFFMVLFSEELLQKLVFETNLYVTQKDIRNAQAHTVPTTLQEIKCFLGLNILMGIKHLPSYKDYWSSREELRDNFIASSMSRNRFSWLLGNLHLNDNSVQPKKGEPTFDKLYKLRPMLDKLSETYAKSYKPSRYQAIDESMIRFKGRSSLRQYMPMKPIKRGYKMWVRANQSGFVSQFQIYTGNAR